MRHRSIHSIRLLHFFLPALVLGVAGCGETRAPGSAASALSGADGGTAQGKPCKTDGECATGSCADGYCCDTPCSGPSEACNVAGKLGTCTPVDLQSDPKHCGDKSTSCITGAACVAGACACKPPTDDCGLSACVDLSKDPQHCGDCSQKCAAGYACVQGACQCPSGVTDCGTFCANLDFDTKHCGYCDNACITGASCFVGNCACTGSTYDCGGGTCVDLLTSKSNCGNCGVVCPTGTVCKEASCVDGPPPCTDAPPAGTCGHAPCTTGAKLVSGCDPKGCVAKICAADSYCCTTEWDDICRGEVTSICKLCCPS